MHPRQNWSDEQTAYWNKLAPKYDSLYSSTWSNQENKQLAAQLQQLKGIKPNTAILDIGCGTGLGYEILSHVISGDFNYFGLDISSEMIDICEQKWSNGKFFVGDMSNLSTFESGTFDIVLSLFSAFSYSEKPLNVLKEIYRVLKPKGELFMSYLSRYSLRRIIHAKFSSIEYYSTRYSTSTMTVPAFVYSYKEVHSHLQLSGFKSKKRFGQGFLSGVLEKPFLWNLDSFAARLLPSFCHIQNIHAEKGNP